MALDVDEVFIAIEAGAGDDDAGGPPINEADAGAISLGFGAVAAG